MTVYSSLSTHTSIISETTIIVATLQHYVSLLNSVYVSLYIIIVTQVSRIVLTSHMHIHTHTHTHLHTRKNEKHWKISNKKNR